MPKGFNGRQIFRAKFSSIAARDIINAFESLSSEPNRFESLSVDARQIIDLKIGVAFSRFQSLYLKKKFQNLNQKMITYGPCQIPTLGFCVDRHEKIINFKPESFFKLNPTILINQNEKYIIFKEGERIEQKDCAEALRRELISIGRVIVSEVSRKESIKNKPDGLNTVALLKHASQALGLGPNDAMHVAEKLYLGGYITYPRTETTSYSQSFDFEEILHCFARSGVQFGGYAGYMIQKGISAPRPGLDAGDHPPITPTPKIPNPSSLSGPEGRMYDFVCRHFLATISDNARLAKTKVSFSCGSQIFNTHGCAVLDLGFTEIAPWISIADKTIPLFEEGNSFPITEATIQEGSTRPPEYLSESELITLMEKNGIGTDASMATHIHNIIERNYAEVFSKMRRIRPTSLGTALLRGYKDIDNELVSPELRSNIEKNVELIAKGERDFQTVLSSVLGIFRQKFLYFRDNIGKLEHHFSGIYGTFQDALKTGIVFSQCGKCKGQMVLVPDFHKIHCANCRLTLNLPKDSKYSITGQDFCPIDNFQIVNYFICMKYFKNSAP